MFYVTVKPQVASDEYRPGELSIMLRRSDPDTAFSGYMYVALKATKMPDGSFVAKIIITPDTVRFYTVNVLDDQPDGRTLMLFSKPLAEIEKKDNKSEMATPRKPFD